MVQLGKYSKHRRSWGERRREFAQGICSVLRLGEIEGAKLCIDDVEEELLPRSQFKTWLFAETWTVNGSESARDNASFCGRSCFDSNGRMDLCAVFPLAFETVLGLRVRTVHSQLSSRDIHRWHFGRCSSHLIFLFKQVLHPSPWLDWKL